jgi:hypothetical protein
MDMAKGTLLYFDPTQRVAMIGWDSGETSVTPYHSGMTDQEIGAMLADYAEPVMIKHGTLVEVPVMPQNPASSIFDDDSYERIALLGQAIHTPLGRIEFLAGYGPRCGRWFVRLL